MRLVIQRVRRGSVSVDDQQVAEIGRGLVILVGVGTGDTEEEAAWLAEKCAYLRIFEDHEGKTNLSLQDVKGEALVVSQFTLYGDARKGRRPSYIDAAKPEIAIPLYNQLINKLSIKYPEHKIATGKFGAMMEISLINDGPVTILLDSEKQF